MPEVGDVLSGIMAAAVRDQRIARNPCDGVSLPRLPEHQQRFLTMTELQDLANHARVYRLMILVLGLCGLRFGECAALRVRSVDLMRRRLRVSESVSEVNGHMAWSTPKTHQSRDVPIPRSLIDALVIQAAGRSRRMCYSAVRMASRSGLRTGGSGYGTLPSQQLASPDLRPTTFDTLPRRWRSHLAR